MIRQIRKMIARMVIGIGGFYAAIDPEMMDEIVAEAQQKAAKMPSPGMPGYEELKKIEDEWVQNKIIN